MKQYSWEDIYQQILDNVNDPLAFIDEQGKLILLNRRFYENVGGEINQEIKNIIGFQEVEESWDEVLAAVQENGYWNGILKIEKTGNIRNGKFANISGGVLLVIHELKQNVENFVNLYQKVFKNIDNEKERSAFMMRLEKEIFDSAQNNRLVTVINLNIDRFDLLKSSLELKQISQLSDQILKRIASLIRGSDILARKGQDNFLIVLANVKNEKDYEIVVNKILSEFERPFLIDNTEQFMTVSLGVSQSKTHPVKPKDLLEKSNIALLNARKLGGNAVQLYKQELEKENENRLDLINKMRKGFREGEFYLKYQPQINLEDFEIIGMEALVRWKNKYLGEVPPAKFIPLMEDTGMIDKLGQWVIKEACKQGKSWYDMGYEDLIVSVNISPVEFRKGNVKGSIDEALEETGLPPENFCIEITETNILGEQQYIKDELNQISDKGIKISLDDFGTDYSSLKYLVNFPFDYVKIDKSFILNLNDKKNEEVSSAIISLAGTLKLNVVAEGVEKSFHTKFLREKGCQIVQGFMFYEPMLPVDLTEELKLKKHNN